jgi:hypothetical protein
MQNCVRIRLEVSTDCRGIFHVALFRHNAAARCHPRTTGLGNGQSKCVKPQPGRSETVVSIVVGPVRFVCVHEARSNRFPIDRAAPLGLL